MKKIKEELKNDWRKTERKHRIEEGNDQIRLREFGRAQAAYNIIFTLRAYALGLA